MNNKQPLVPRGIEPMCGWQWVYAHYHDLDDWIPTLEISRNGYRVKVSSKDIDTLNEVTKITMRR